MISKQAWHTSNWIAGKVWWNDITSFWLIVSVFVTTMCCQLLQLTWIPQNMKSNGIRFNPDLPIKLTLMVCMQGNKHWLSISNYFLVQENKIFIRWRCGIHGEPGRRLRLFLECFFRRAGKATWRDYQFPLLVLEMVLNLSLTGIKVQVGNG